MMEEIEYNEMKQRGKKLNQLTVILEQILVKHKQSTKLLQFPIYRIEVWLGNTIVDQTADIIAKYDKKKQELKLTIGSASFKYKHKQLFGSQKIARMGVKLIRHALLQPEEELLDQFSIVLSQYAFEYSLEIRPIWSYHSIGKYSSGILNYTVKCSYFPRDNTLTPETSPSAHLQSLPLLNKFSSYKLPDNGFEFEELLPHKKISSGYLMFDALSENDALSDRTYVSYKRLKPVYRQMVQQAQNRLLIRLDKSFIGNQVDIPHDSTIEEQTKVTKVIGKVLNVTYYIYMCVCLWLFIWLLIPDVKV